MKRFMKTHWRDIVFVLLCLIVNIVAFQAVTQWDFNEPLAFFAVIASGIYAIFTFVILVRSKKKRALKDWFYPVYGVLFSLLMLFYIFAAFPYPWVPMDSYSGRIAASRTLSITFYFVTISSIVRLIVRIVKKRKKKDPKNMGNDDMKSE